jgi:glycosyltransferase involved in cell wall biosynthesis
VPDARRRVIHLSAYEAPYPGSFVPMLRAAGDAVRRLGPEWSFELAFTARAGGRAWLEELRADGILVHLAPARTKAQAVRWLRALLAGDPRAPLLHSHFSFWDLPAALAGRAARDGLVVWHLHSVFDDSWRLRARNTATCALGGRMVQRILCVGPEVEAGARRRLAPARRMLRFANGIDLERFRALEEHERRAARERLAFPADAAVLVAFLWEWQHKGGDLFLAAAELLRSRGREVIAVPVTLSGAIPAAVADGRVRPLAAGPDGRVRPLAAGTDVLTILAAADVFVAASRAEGGGPPFSVLESLATGTPVVASDIPGHRVLAGAPALRLAKREAASLADAIAAELDARPTLRARAKATRAQLQRFSLAAWGERLGDLYAELAGR